MIINLYIGKDLIRSVETDVLPRIGESVEMLPEVNGEATFKVVGVVHSFEDDDLASFSIVLK